MGITIIRRKNIPTILYPLDVGACFGIGKRSVPALKEMGINTIGDLANRINNEDANVKKHMGKFFYVLKNWLNGYGDDEVIVEPWDPKSIGHSHTLMHNTNDFDEINKVLLSLVDQSIQRAKEKGKLAKGVQITLKDATMQDGRFASITRSKQLEKATLDENIIKKTATALLKANLNGRIIVLLECLSKISLIKATTSNSFPYLMITKKSKRSMRPSY